MIAIVIIVVVVIIIGIYGKRCASRFNQPDLIVCVLFGSVSALTDQRYSLSPVSIRPMALTLVQAREVSQNTNLIAIQAQRELLGAAAAVSLGDTLDRDSWQYLAVAKAETELTTRSSRWSVE